MPEPIPAAPHVDAPALDARAATPPSASDASVRGPPTADIQATFLRHLEENYLPQAGSVRIDPGDDLFDSGILDSAAVLSVILFIEQEFAITIPDEDLLPENVASVDAAVAYITRRLDGRQPTAPNGEESHDVREEVPRLGPR